jgi:hypothetical protein
MLDPTTKLFARQVNLTIGMPSGPLSLPFNDANSTGLTVDGLDIEFDVEKSLKSSEPNKARIKVWNLTRDHIKAIGQAQALTVRLEAGYEGNTAQVYYGGIRSAHSTREGDTDFVTILESENTVAKPGIVSATKKVTTSSFVSVPQGPRVSLSSAISTLAPILGVTTGDLTAALAGKEAILISGSSLHGNAAQRMTDICRSAGLEWSIQDEVLQLVDIGKALTTTTAFNISPDTGLVGSPTSDSQGVVEATVLLTPGLAPGVLVNFVGAGDPSGLTPCIFVNGGGYRIDKIRAHGSTFSRDYYHSFTAVKY